MTGRDVAWFGGMLLLAVSLIGLAGCYWWIFLHPEPDPVDVFADLVHGFRIVPRPPFDWSEHPDL